MSTPKIQLIVIISFQALKISYLQLVRFLCTAALRYAQVNEDCELYICGGFEDPTKCFKLQGSTFFEVSDLNSNHLEADSRI